ncbi:hypothetical protein FSP39_011504 [Pinctada imbricata]|uniref:Uncharacterized protein n=1 Tax=Pinctada imbricata TaxID=66713 RepID=A0AA89BYI2_PINIB|nr:hypothetical protein FSP39_011504 [Pinctada imbricata]
MAHELGIHNTNVGDQTNSLAIQHQAMSAGTNGTGYVQHQNHGGPAHITTASPQTTIQPVSPSSTCAPLRCLPPCNKGLTIDSKGCPKCVC